jgi:hypothetical protein
VLLPGAYGTFHVTPGGGHLEIVSGRLNVKIIELPVTGEVDLIGMAAPHAVETRATSTVFTFA